MDKRQRDAARLRSEVRKLDKKIDDTKTEILNSKKEINPFTGLVSGNYWTQTGMPWVSSEGRKAVLTEWFWQPIRGQPRRVDTNELRQFCQTYWVHACVRTIIEEVCTLEWDIVPKEDIPYEAVRDQIREIKAFLAHPNKNDVSFEELTKGFVKDILELDAGVLVKVFDVNSYDFEQLEPKSGAPLLKPLGERNMVEIYARDGASFLIEADKFGFERGYWQYSYQIPAHPMWFNRDEIVYTRQHPRSMSVYGFAVPQAIMDIIKSLHYSALYNKRFFEETPIPDGALALLDTNDAEMKTFINYWNNEFKAQPHKMAVINKDIKWQPFATSNRELEFLETQKWYFRMVITAFGLTPAELGITEDLNRATSATQAEVSKRKAIRPILKLIENAINTGILPEFGAEDIEFQYIYDDPLEKNQRLQNWQMEVNMGLKTINEIRNEEGLQPVDWGESPTQLLPVAQAGPEPGISEGPTGMQDQEGVAEQREEDDAKPAHEEDRKNEDQKERDAKVKNPFSMTNRPVGSFKALKEKKKTPEEMFEEERQEHPEFADEVIWQIVHDHMKKDSLGGVGAQTTADPGMSKDLAGTNAATYYHGPEEKIKPHRGLIVQPQNAAQPRDNPHLVAPPLGSDRRNPQRDLYVSPNQFEGQSEVRCPFCGYNTLTEFTSADDVGKEPMFRCTNCTAMVSRQELIDNAVLANMVSAYTENNSTKPITVPRWSPKSYVEKSDVDMDLKDFCGFDYSKSVNYTIDYINSKEYEAVINKYFPELSAKEKNRFKQILADTVAQGKSIREATEKLTRIFKEDRADMIARTETIRVLNEGNKLHMKDRGVEKVLWISAPEDGRLCKECAKRNMKAYPINSKEAKVPLHPGCRCTLTEHSEFV